MIYRFEKKWEEYKDKYIEKKPKDVEFDIGNWKNSKFEENKHDIGNWENSKFEENKHDVGEIDDYFNQRKNGSGDSNVVAFFRQVNPSYINHYDNKIDSAKSKNWLTNSLTDIITVSADEIIDLKDDIKAKVSELVKKGRKVNVIVDGCAQFKDMTGNERIEYTFNGSKLLEICDFDNELKQLGMKESIKFNEFFETTQNSDLSTCWDLDQVFDANASISEIVWKIRKLELFPYETMVYIHKYLTKNYGYGFNADGDKDTSNRDIEKNRSIVSAIQNKQYALALHL